MKSQEDAETKIHRRTIFLHTAIQVPSLLETLERQLKYMLLWCWTEFCERALTDGRFINQTVDTQTVSLLSRELMNTTFTYNHLKHGASADTHDQNRSALINESRRAYNSSPWLTLIIERLWPDLIYHEHSQPACTAANRTPTTALLVLSPLIFSLIISR